MGQERILLKTLPIQDLLRNARSPASPDRAGMDRRPDERLPWSEAAPLLLILSIAGWGGLILLWNLVF
jgi:hypothetical protein